MCGVEKHDGVYIIDCPVALDPNSMGLLHESLHRALDDEKIRYIFLKGNSGGDGHIFCHGMSLEFVATDPSDYELSASFHTLRDIIASINNAEKPTIAMVSGSVMGGGVGLVAACDVVLADHLASFSLPEGLYGLLPGAIIPFILQRVSQPRLKYMIFTADTVRGERAAQWGLADHYFSSEVSMHQYAEKLLKSLNRIHPEAISSTKKLLRVLTHDQLTNLGMKLSLEKITDPACKKIIKDYVTYGILPSITRQ
jgi:enoyl-CoA hydratase/carnithine racemase